MSLIVPIFVNSTQVGEITITRTEPLKDATSLHTYMWHARYRPLNADGAPADDVVYKGGTVTHRYDRGWSALLAKVLVQLDTGVTAP
ncbi:hypothetical protein [Mycolicibacterium phlei]|uniref:hypothetical protein n=1 Tax=Mycolicibacterium phlei TaxID=1771 RepID=UPI0002EB85A1|nr:hypothetical protein [Mycolicibacterium phlei]MBF4194599.1 hypothetical protein [Mycolicibacterium phlei]